METSVSLKRCHSCRKIVYSKIHVGLKENQIITTIYGNFFLVCNFFLLKYSCYMLCVFRCVQLFVDYSPPGSSVHGIFQARILEWVGISSSVGSSRPWDGTQVFCGSCIGRWILDHSAAWKPLYNIRKVTGVPYNVSPFLTVKFQLSLL